MASQKSVDFFRGGGGEETAYGESVISCAHSNEVFYQDAPFEQLPLRAPQKRQC